MSTAEAKGFLTADPQGLVRLTAGKLGLDGRGEVDCAMEAKRDKFETK